MMTVPRRLLVSSQYLTHLRTNWHFSSLPRRKDQGLPYHSSTASTNHSLHSPQSVSPTTKTTPCSIQQHQQYHPTRGWKRNKIVWNEVISTNLYNKGLISVTRRTKPTRTLTIPRYLLSRLQRILIFWYLKLWFRVSPILWSKPKLLVHEWYQKTWLTSFQYGFWLRGVQS